MFLSFLSMNHLQVSLAKIHMRTKGRGEGNSGEPKKGQKWAIWIQIKSWHLANQSNKGSEPSPVWQACMHFSFLIFLKLNSFFPFHSACRAVKLVKVQNFIWLIPLLATCHWEQHLMCQKCVKKILHRVLVDSSLGDLSLRTAFDVSHLLINVLKKPAKGIGCQTTVKLGQKCVKKILHRVLVDASLGDLSLWTAFDMSNLVINVLKKSCIGHCLTPQLLKTMMTCQVTLCSMHAILQPDCKTKKPQSITKLGCLSNLYVPACNYQNQLMCGYQTPTLCRVFSEKEEV